MDKDMFDIVMEKGIFEMYKKGDIVDPSVVARFYREPINEAFNRCNERVGKDLKKMYMIRCPFCSNNADDERHYAVADIPKKDLCCVKCGCVFTPSKYNTFALYEKTN